MRSVLLAMVRCDGARWNMIGTWNNYDPYPDAEPARDACECEWCGDACTGDNPGTDYYLRDTEGQPFRVLVHRKGCLADVAATAGGAP